MKNKLFLVYIIISIILINIGYAAVNSITGEVKGIALATPLEEVFISDVILKDNINSEYKINYNKTLLDSEITLLKPNSKISFLITVYNNTLEPYSFNDVLYGQEWYSNDNISFKLKGIKKNDILKSKESITFEITFSYKDKNNINNNKLTSILNFNFKKMYKVNYVNFNDINLYPQYAFNNSELKFTFPNNNFSVKMNNKLLTLGNEYNYQNNILKINNVVGDIEIINNNWFLPLKNNTYLIDNSTEKLKISNENWTNNIYNLNIDVKNIKNKTYNYKFEIKIKNISKEVWKYGTSLNSITPSYIFGQNNNLKIKTSLSSNLINPNEILTISFDINYKLNNSDLYKTKTKVRFIINRKIEIFELNINYNLI